MGGLSMGKKHEVLLTIDGIINLILGIILLLFPVGVAELLGVPKSPENFYPTILGAVIFGIGIALLMERYGLSKHIRGLGLGGAIAINLCGALALFVWLLCCPLQIPLRGYVILWSIAIVVVAVGIVEVVTKSWKYH
jgi:hypothetical protein